MLLGGVFRNAERALSSRGWNCRNAGMALRPSAITVSISFGVRLTSTSGGVVGGVPWRDAPWQAAHVRS